MKITNYTHRFFYFSFQFCLFLLHVVCSSVIGCIGVQDCYVLMIQGPAITLDAQSVSCLPRESAIKLAPGSFWHNPGSLIVFLFPHNKIFQNAVGSFLCSVLESAISPRSLVLFAGKCCYLGDHNLCARIGCCYSMITIFQSLFRGQNQELHTF